MLGGFFKEQWKYAELFTLNDDEEGLEAFKKQSFNEKIEWADSEGWKDFDTVDGVKLEHKATKGSNITLTRGTMTFKGDFDKFVASLFDSSLEAKKKIFEDMVSNSVVKKIDDHNIIVHSQFRAPFGISWREFVVLKSHGILDDGRHVITAHSINYKPVPFTKGYVRGVAKSGMIITPPKEGSNEIKIVKVEHVDPKGLLPSGLINMMKGKVGKTLSKMPVYL